MTTDSEYTEIWTELILTYSPRCLGIYLELMTYGRTAYNSTTIKGDYLPYQNIQRYLLVACSFSDDNVYRYEKEIRG